MHTLKYLVEVSILQIMIKEEDRLTSVIADIDDDVAIVPRGAFLKWPTGEVVPNRSFEGLNISGDWLDLVLRADYTNHSAIAFMNGVYEWCL